MISFGLAVVAGGLYGGQITRVEAAGSPDGLTVAVAFYPIEELVRQVGGADVAVVNLTPPGGGPHDLELSPQKAAELGQADVVFFIGRGFQPIVQNAVEALDDSVVKIDLLDTVELLPVSAQLEGTQGDVDGEVLEGNTDPHIWVDPVNMVTMAGVVEETLSAASPDNAAAFATNAAAYVGVLSDLDDEFSTQLADCESRTIVTSHRAFEYLAQRYDLEQIAIAGISPDEEPDPRTLQAVADAAEAKGVTVVFFEEQVPPDLAETVAREIGASTDALDPVETITQDRLDDGTTYITIQQDNLAALVGALRCT